MFLDVVSNMYHFPGPESLTVLTGRVPSFWVLIGISSQDCNLYEL